MSVSLEIVRALVESQPSARVDEASLLVPMAPDQLPLAWRIDWEERAAILQYDAGRSRDEAERQALEEIVDRLQRGSGAGAFGQRAGTSRRGSSDN